MFEYSDLVKFILFKLEFLMSICMFEYFHVDCKFVVKFDIKFTISIEVIQFSILIIILSQHSFLRVKTIFDSNSIQNSFFRLSYDILWEFV